MMIYLIETDDCVHSDNTILNILYNSSEDKLSSLQIAYFNTFKEKTKKNQKVLQLWLT